MSRIGKDEEKNYIRIPILPSNSNSDSDYINSFEGQVYSCEEEFNNEIYSLFEGILLVLEQQGIILVNAEQLIDTNYDSDRKPDFLLFHKAFIIEKERRSNGNCKYYGTIHPDAQDQLLTLFEGKITNIDTNTNLGILFNYVNIMANLRIEYPVGVLYNQRSFFICDANQSKLFQAAAWNYSSIEFLKEKILAIPFPRLTDFLLQLCHYFEAETEIGGYCGKGSSGYCFKVKVKDETKVLKIIMDSGLSTFQDYCLSEYQNTIRASTEFPLITISIYPKLYLDENCCGFLFDQFGRQISRHYQRVTDLFALLFNLHKSRFVHGDPIIYNIVEVLNSSTNLWELKFIDFASFKSLDLIPARIQSQRIFQDLNLLWKSLDFVKDLPARKHQLSYDESIIRSYCENCNDSNFKELAHYLRKFKAK